MKVKFGILSLALSVGAVTLFADDNTKGIDFYRAGMLDEAKAVLLANLQNDKVDKAETCYYLGEVYSDLNMKDSAAYYYKEGLVADPDYVFNSIGELKLGLKENPNQDSAFDGFFTGKNKKNPLIYIAVARAYLPVSIDKAKEYMEKAQKEREAMKAEREKQREKMLAMREDKNAQMKKILTEEQYKQYLEKQQPKGNKHGRKHLGNGRR